MPELPAIFCAHHVEIEDDQSIPLDPDWSKYAHMEMIGQLHIMTARDEGILVGYYFAVVVSQLHHKQRKVAFSDMFFVLPDYRAGWNGIKLIRRTERMLKKLGVTKTYLVTKDGYPITILLKRLKYVLTELVHMKML